MRILTIAFTIITTLAANGSFGDTKFDPAIIVNESIISKFEVSQRVMLLNILRINGNINEKAKDELINAKLIEEFVKKYDLDVSRNIIEDGITELANQFNLNKNDFLFETSKIDISREAIEAIVRDRILLKEVVQYKFANRAQIEEDEIDAYIMNGSASLNVKLSEIVLPFKFDTKNEVYNTALALKDRLLEGITFESIAKTYSRSPSAPSGGKLDWISIDQIPIEIANILLTTEKNSIIGPKVYDSFINLYKLIDIQEVPLFNDTRIILDFVELLYPKESEINSHALTLIFENNNNCLNLKFELEKYEALKSNITHTSLEQTNIPMEKFEVLENLDAGEASVLKYQNGDVKFLMLCSRQQKISKSDRYKAQQYLFSQRLSSLADGFLADLKAEAKIIYR
jgi:peptidyl-prolyl cis-trans isomerase SurA